MATVSESNPAIVEETTANMNKVTNVVTSTSETLNSLSEESKTSLNNTIKSSSQMSEKIEAVFMPLQKKK